MSGFEGWNSTSSIITKMSCLDREHRACDARCGHCWAREAWDAAIEAAAKTCEFGDIQGAPLPSGIDAAKLDNEQYVRVCAAATIRSLKSKGEK